MTTQSQIKQKSNGNLLGFSKQRKACPGWEISKIQENSNPTAKSEEKDDGLNTIFIIIISSSFYSWRKDLSSQPPKSPLQYPERL